MDGISFALSLVDGVGGPAKRAAAALRDTDKAAKKARESLNFEKELKKTEESLKKLKVDPKGFKELIEAQKKLADERKKLGKEPFFKELGGEIGKHFSFGKLLGAEVLAESIVEGAKKAVEVFTEGVSEAFKAAAQHEKVKLSYGLMFGEKGAEKLEDQERFAKNTPLFGSQLATLMRPLYSSGMGDKAARQAVSTSGDLAARTGRPIEEFVDMMEKIQNKGGISEKMLTGAGLNVKDFFAGLAKTTGLSPDEAKKRASEGKLDPQILMNQITTSTNKSQGGEAGTGWLKLSETMGARFEKLKALPEQFFEKISDTAGWKKLSDALGGVLEKLNPDGPIGKKVIGKLMTAFDDLSTKVSGMLTEENIDAFLLTLEKIPGVIDTIITVSEVLGTIWVGSQVVGALTTIAGVLPVIGTAAGVAVGAVAAITAPMLVAAAAIAGVGAAIYEVITHWKELKEAVEAPGKTFDLLTDALSGKSANPDLDTAKPLTANEMRHTTLAPVFNVAVNGDVPDPRAHGQKIAQATGYHIVNLLEASAQQGGAR